MNFTNKALIIGWAQRISDMVNTMASAHAKMRLGKYTFGIVLFNKTKDWALVQNAASAGGVKVELGLFR